MTTFEVLVLGFVSALLHCYTKAKMLPHTILTPNSLHKTFQVVKYLSVLFPESGLWFSLIVNMLEICLACVPMVVRVVTRLASYSSLKWNPGTSKFPVL